MFGVIYLIRNLKNGKCYIGKTTDLKNRIRHHFGGHSKACKALHRAIKKYGKDIFSVEILYEGIIPELLSDFEIQAIKEYNTVVPNGYNLTWGGEGGKLSEESLEKLRGKNNHFFGKKLSKEHREKLSEIAKKRTGEKNPFYGRKHSEESKQKQSETKKGTPAHNKSPLRIPARELFNSLPETMNIIEKRNALHKKFPELHSDTLMRWVREWSGATHKISRKSQYHIPARELFDSLPTDMPKHKKIQTLCENFPDVPMSTIQYWVYNKWKSNAKTQKELAYEFYITLPAFFSLKEKRQILQDRFSVSGRVPARWIKEWTGEILPIGASCHPERPKVYEFFLSIPSDIDLKGKRKLLQQKFPNIKKSLIHRWTSRWQSDYSIDALTIELLF